MVVSGFNVYSNEVEVVVAAISGVAEAAAVAQADEHSGEVVAVFVVSKDPALSERAVIDKCRESRTRYKPSRHVYFRSELPKSNVGEMLRRVVRDSLMQQTPVKN